MYCYHCGKDIAEEALMCPNCGAPTKNTVKQEQNTVKQEQNDVSPVTSCGLNIKALSVVGLILSVAAFAIGIVFGGFLMNSRYSASMLFYVIGVFAIIPAFAGMSIGAYVATIKEKDYIARACSICSIVFASFVLLFLFVICCAFADGAL